MGHQAIGRRPGGRGESVQLGWLDCLAAWEGGEESGEEYWRGLSAGRSEGSFAGRDARRLGQAGQRDWRVHEREV